MKVENKTLYHISRENDWSVGNVLTAGENENQFWRLCKDFSPNVTVNDTIMSVFQMIEHISDFDVTQNNISFLYQTLKTISKETAFYIREQTFEDIRRSFFPALPSRQTCLWVCEEKEIPYWKTMSNSTQRSLLTLELDGELFRADAQWLSVNTFSSLVYAERAKHYCRECSNHRNEYSSVLASYVPPKWFQ